MTAAPLSDDLRTLYQEVILDHGKHPRNLRVVEHHTCKAQGNNPMCGDRVTVTARVSPGGVLEDVAFEGKRLRHFYRFGLDDERSPGRAEGRGRAPTFYGRA